MGVGEGATGGALPPTPRLTVLALWLAWMDELLFERASRRLINASCSLTISFRAEKDPGSVRPRGEDEKESAVTGLDPGEPIFSKAAIGRCCVCRARIIKSSPNPLPAVL